MIARMKAPDRGRLPALLAVLFTLLPSGHAAQLNSLTAQEISERWILLFDGETTFG